MFSRRIARGDTDVRENSIAESEYHVKMMTAFTQQIQLPVAKLCGLETIMDSIDPGDKIYKYAECINTCAFRLSSMATNVKKYYELKMNVYVGMKTTFLFHDEIGRIWQKFMTSFNDIRTKNTYKDEITCNLIIKDTLPTGRVNGDLSNIKCIFNNLIQNAYIYTESGNIEIEISSTVSDDDSVCNVVMEIIDTGSGIHEEDQKFLFDPFFKSQHGGPKGLGPGLGLSVSREVCKSMGGDLILSSTGATGSTFKATFQLSISDNKCMRYSEMRLGGVKERVPPLSVENQELDKEKDDISNTITSKKKILIVEDSEIVLKLMMSFLRGDNFDVVCKYNGQEAVDACNIEKYDIIFMDLSMPVMDGFTAIDIIKTSCSLNFSTPIVVLTGTLSGNTGSLFKSKGIVHFLSKPIKKAVLIRMIAKYTMP